MHVVTMKIKKAILAACGGSKAGFTPKIKFGIFPSRNKTIVGLVLDTLTFANVVQPLDNAVRSLDILYLLLGCW
jgi:hypothetical protein